MTGELFRANRYRRNEMPQDALDRIDGDAPNSKEPQNVVDAKSIKVVAHLGESLFPPGEAVFLHVSPVVSRKAPVLSLCGESVWRGACLHLHVIKLGLLPGIHAETGHADGDVTLQHHPFAARIFSRRPQL